MKFSVKTAVCGLFAAAAMSAAQAAPITVGGITWDPDSPLDFSSFSIAIRQFIDPGTGVVSGFGIITTMNGTGQSVFAPGAELTFQFGGFTPIGSTILPSVGTSINYTGGFVNVFVDSSPEINNPSDPTTLTFANTGDGALWLGLVGNVGNAGISFTGSADINTGLSGSGRLDVVGGLAQANFDTNTRPFNSDFTFSNSFTLFPNNNFFNSLGTGNFFSNSIAIPEPGALALAGLALIAAGVARRTKPV